MSETEKGRPLFPDEMDEALNNGFEAVERWYAGEIAVERASEQATDAMRDAISHSSLSLRQIARLARLSPAAVSSAASPSGKLDHLSSNATWRVLEVIRAHAAERSPSSRAPSAERSQGDA